MTQPVPEPDPAVRQVRLLANDPAGDAQIFTDDEIRDFLALEDDSVKRAAAQAIDTIADNEALVAKVITDHNLSTDGAKVADSLRKRAAALRDQADDEDEDAGFFVDVFHLDGHPGPEHTAGRY